MGSIKSISSRIVRSVFVIYISINMLICALLFAPIALPRETLCGMAWRFSCTKSGIAGAIAQFFVDIFDHLHFWEENHCHHVYITEHMAREHLYPEIFYREEIAMERK